MKGLSGFTIRLLVSLGASGVLIVNIVNILNFRRALRSGIINLCNCSSYVSDISGVLLFASVSNQCFGASSSPSSALLSHISTNTFIYRWLTTIYISWTFRFYLHLWRKIIQWSVDFAFTSCRTRTRRNMPVTDLVKVIWQFPLDGKRSEGY